MNLYRPDGRLRGCGVYMLFCHDPADDGPVYIKIGYANVPLERLNQLLARCPLEPKEFAWTETSTRRRALAIEQSLHRICAPWCAKGEWFSVSMEARAEFRKLCNQVLDLFREPAWPLTWGWIDVPAFLADQRRRVRARAAIIRKMGGLAYLDARRAGLLKNA